MASETEHPTALDDLDWHELEDTLAEVAALAKGEIPFEDLAAELLDRTVEMLAAVGGGVWLRDGRGSLRLLSQINLAALGEDQEAFHRPLLQEALTSGEIQVVMPDSTLAGRNVPGNPRGYLLVLSPLKTDRDVVGVIEIVQRATLSPSALRGNRRFLALVGELASDCLLRHELRRLRAGQAHAGHFAAFAGRVHSTLDLKATAYELANEGRRLIGCDRVGVAIRRGRAYRLVAMSGVDTIERRSNTVHRVEQLAATIGRTGQPFWYDGLDRDLPPQIAEPLHLYLDQAHVRTVGVLPLTAKPSAGGRTAVFGVFIVEQFDAECDGLMRDTAASVADHGRQALLNAIRYESLPSLPFARRRNLEPGRSLFGVRGALATLAAGCLVAALCLVPADFTVYAEGQLQPLNRQHIFAPMDGQVTELAVGHAEIVAAGQTLIVLDSPTLDLDIQRVQGEYETARKRLLVVESALLQTGSAAERDGKRRDQLASEQEELLQLLESQSKQLQLLRRQRRELTLRSPIAGQVLTWELDQLLLDRPVQRGQTLMTVADLSGRWIAQLEVPDDQMGYVLRAVESERQPLAVSFQLATDRSGSYAGTVRNVASRTDINDAGRPGVKVAVDFDEARVPVLRPGATIFAKIHCGRKSLGYAWLHELIETLRGWTLF